MIFDEVSCAMLMKGKIQINNRLISLNVVQIFYSIAEFTDQILRKSTKGTQQFKVELKAFVDGA